jgi:hypothetical protein
VAERTLCFILLALNAMTHEPQPILLLLYVLLPLLHAPVGIVIAVQELLLRHNIIRAWRLLLRHRTGPCCYRCC